MSLAGREAEAHRQAIGVHYGVHLASQSAARLVRKHWLDDGPLMVTEFIAHDSRLQFGNLNHVPADTFKGKPPCLEWPNDRTYGKSCQIDAIGQTGHQPIDKPF
jgi:hypothetical protein